MPSYSVSASEIKYASGSSWTSGKARQGVYSSTRYEGALNFAGLANFSFSNIEVTGIQMRVTFGPTGGSSTKYLTLYGGAKNSISGSIASMPVISGIASGGKIMRKEQALLTREQFERELNYDAALSVARRMLAAGLISRAEFVRIDAILREKFSPVWGGLYHSVA